MADIKLINNSFVQQGSICAMASYSIVIEYFSNIRIECVLNNYIEEFELSYLSVGNRKVENKQKAIYDHFHKYCGPRNLRGFEFIRHLHENDNIKTRQYCNIVISRASLQKISDEDIERTRKELMDNEALAIVLYKVDENNFHAVVIGYDPQRQEYFYKDPERNKIEYGDILSAKEITELIVFNDK